jgi:hypothetical protein
MMEQYCDTVIDDKMSLKRIEHSKIETKSPKKQKMEEYSLSDIDFYKHNEKDFVEQLLCRFV